MRAAGGVDAEAPTGARRSRMVVRAGAGLGDTEFAGRLGIARDVAASWCAGRPARYGPRTEREIVRGRFGRFWPFSNTIARSSWHARGGALALFDHINLCGGTPRARR